MAERSGFSLDNLREGVKDKSEELSGEAAPRSITDENRDGIYKPYTFEQPDYDRTEPPKDNMRDYWRKFETTPIIRKPITSFASRVTEPGYYVEAEGVDKDKVEEIGNWLNKCAIIEGQPNKDFRLLAKKAIIQQEVRGTALVEKAPHKDNNDKLAGLKLINPETVEAVTRPNQSILMAPEDIEEYADAPKAESGGAAAWLQDVVETNNTQWGEAIKNKYESNDDKIGFRRDEIVPLTRDADVGEVFGTSRIEAVADRIEGLKQKLDDNDKAIASKAYPLWLFLFGSNDNPWDSQDINKFMKAHEMENFHPGMKQGVRGDVSVETISGEVANISEYLDFDIQWIMASMPMPMFLLGAFGGKAVGRIAGVAQQQDVVRQIEEARRELQEEFTPVVREVAQQKGVSEEDAKNIVLKFGKPGQPDPEVSRSQNIIRYVSDAKDENNTRKPKPQQPQPQKQQGQQQGGQQQDNGKKVHRAGGNQQGVNTTDVVDRKQATQDIRSQAKNSATVGKDIWDVAEDIPFSPKEYEELAKGDTVDSDSEDELAGDIGDLFLKVRDDALDKVERKYQNSPKYAAGEFERIADKTLNRAVSAANLHQSSRKIVRKEVQEVSDEYGGNSGPFSHSHDSSFFAQNIVNAVRDASEEMLRRARVHIRNGVETGEKWSDVRQRVENEFGKDYLHNRASIISQMELKKAIETTKLKEFEADDSIIGVRVYNDNPSTPLTKSLNGAEGYFNRNSEFDDQIANQVDSTLLNQGFKPLPRTPPYHYGDTTQLRPIYKNNEGN